MKKYLVLIIDFILGFGLLFDLLYHLWYHIFESTFYITLAFCFFVQYLHEVISRKEIEKCLQCNTK